MALGLAVAAVATFWLGLRWNRDRKPGERTRHSFWFVPLQFWAIPMMLFAILVGIQVVKTSPDRSSLQATIPATHQK